jgi:cytidylate kinase
MKGWNVMDNFVITIARGYGSGGRTIGKMIAKELGINFYDRELLRLASDDSGINEKLFGKVDEKLKTSLLYKIAKRTYKGELIPPDSDDFISNDNLFNYQAKVIRELAKEESCVIVGRCADYVLKNYSNVIRLFVHAPIEHCVDNIADISSEPRKELEKKIHSIDKNRGEYYSYYTKRRWNDAHNYDLCINTSELSYKQVVELVKAYRELLRLEEV